MAVNIDERVVEMRFDNKRFEQNIHESIDSLNSLDDSIDNVGKNNFSKLTSALKVVLKKVSKLSLSINPITSSIYNVWNASSKAFKNIQSEMDNTINKSNEMRQALDDNGVVEVRFNTGRFRDDIQDTVTYMDALDQSVKDLDYTNVEKLDFYVNDMDFGGVSDSLDILQNDMNSFGSSGSAVINKLRNGMENLFLDEGINNEIDHIRFDNLLGNMGVVQTKMTTLGVVGATIIQDITRQLESLAVKAIKVVDAPFQQIKTGGWSRALKIQDAKFQLEGLGVAWDKIKGDIDYAVSGTAYGLDSAAKAASQLVASGVELGDSMKAALRGISGVAAMANVSYEEIAPIFTTVAGQGKLMTMQLRQLEARGLNVAATLGQSLGKSEQAVREMVTDGKINFEMFATAMDDAFGQHAKDANKTFTGSLGNMKTALSRIGAEMADTYMTGMIDVFNDLRTGINDVHVRMQPMIDEINNWIKVVTSAASAGLRWVMSNDKLMGVFDRIANTFYRLSNGLANFIMNYRRQEHPILKNLKAIAGSIVEIVTAIFGLTKHSGIGLFQEMLAVTLELLYKVTSVIANVLNYIAKSQIFQWIAENLGPIVKVLLPALIGYLILSKLHLVKVVAVMSAIAAAIYAIQKFGLVERLKNLRDTLKDLAERTLFYIKKIVTELGPLGVVIGLIWAKLHKAYRTMQLINGIKNASGLKGIVGFITGVTGALKGWTYNTRMMAKINMIKTVVLGVIALAATAAVISKYTDVSKFTSIAAVMGIMAAELVLLLSVIEKIDSEKSFAQLFDQMVVLASIAGMMFVVGAALSKVAQYDWEKIVAAGSALSATAIAMATSLIMLNSIETDPARLLSIAAAITIIGLGLAGLALGISVLAKAPIDAMWNAIGVLTVMTVTAAGMVGLLSAFPEAAAVAIPVAIALAATLVAMSASAVGFALATTMFTDALVKLFDFLVANKDTIQESLTNFGAGIYNLVKALGSSVIEIGSSIAIALTTTMEKVITGIIHALQSGGIELLDSIEKIVVKLFEVLTITRDNLLTFISNSFIMLGYAIRHGLEGLYAVAVKGEEVGKWIGVSIANGIQESNKEAALASMKLGGIIEDNIRNKLDIHSESPKLREIGKWVTKSIAKGIYIATPGSMKYVIKAVTTITKGIQKKLKIGASEDSRTFLEKFIDGLKENSLVKKITNAGEDLGSNWGQGFFETVEKYCGYAKDAVNDMVGDLTETYGFGDMFDGLFGKDKTYEDYKQQARTALQKRYENDKAFHDIVSKEMKSLQSRKLVQDYAFYETEYWQKEEEALAKRLQRDQSASYRLSQYFKNLQNNLDPNKNKNKQNNGNTPTNENDYFGDGDNKDKKQQITLIEKLIESMQKAVEVFGDFDRTVKMTTDDLFNNVNDQIKGMTEWSEGVQILMKRGFSKDIIESIMAMGPEASFKYVATLLEMTPKQMKRYNKKIKKSMSMPAEVLAEVGEAFTANGKHVSKKYLKGLKDGVDDAWDEYSIGDRTATLTGKALKNAFEKQMGKLNIQKLLKKNGIKSFTDALGQYFDGVTSKSKKTKAATSEYITAAYMATLNETQMQAALQKSTEELGKDVQKWWKEQQKSVEESTLKQIRAMSDLDKAYDKSGKEYKKQLEKQNKDYKQAQENKRFLLATGKAYGLGKKGLNYIEGMDESEILSLIDVYENEYAGDLDEFGAWFVKTIKGGAKKESEKESAFKALMETSKAEDLITYLKKQKKKISDIQSPIDRYNEAIGSIQDGINELTSKNTKIKGFAAVISRSFVSLSENIDIGTDAITRYADSLLELRKESIMEEVAEAGVDVSEVVKKHLEEIADSMEEWQKNVKDSLKSTLQSFNEFDKGEKKSLTNMIKNLQGNITSLNEWRANIKKMQELGYSQSLIDYMASQGISSYQEVAALTGDVAQYQIDEINQMWGQVADDSESAATDALGSMILAVDTVGKDTVDGITTTFIEQYGTKKDYIAAGLADTTGEAVAKGFSDVDVTEPAKSLTASIGSTLVKFLLGGTNIEIPKAIQEFTSKFFGITVDSTVEKTGNNTKKKAKKKGKQIGKASVLGAVEGLKEAKPALGSAVEALCDYATNKAKKKLDIHSPSRVFQQLGELTAEGFAIGFGDSTYKTTDQVDDFTNAIIAYAQRLVNDLDAAMPEDDDFTIKPVLDLDNLQNANSAIQSLLGNGDIAVRTNMLAGQIATQGDWSMLSKALSGMGGNSTTNTYGDIQITVNAPEGADANEIANAVMAKIQQSVDRRKYV